MKKSVLRIAPVAFLIIAVLSLYTGISCVLVERNLYNQQIELNKLSQKLNEVSDFLTEQAKSYVQYGVKYYLEEYYKETQITKTRDKILQDLEDMNIPESEIEFIAKTIELSFELEKYETNAFDLYDDGEVEEARELLFNDKYAKGKQPIKDTIKLFQNAFEERCVNGITNSQYISISALVLMCLSIIIFITITYILYVRVNRKAKGITEMSDVIEHLTMGEFDIDMNRFNLRGELDPISTGLSGIVETIYGMENEVRRLVNDTITGNFSYETAHDNFKGGWAKMLLDLNKATKTVRKRIIENAPIAYIIVKDNVITDYNRYAYEQIGMQTGEYIESYYKDVFEKMEIQRKLKRDGVLEKEKVTFKLRSGDFRRYSLYINVMETGNEHSMILWGMDIEDEERKNDIIRRNQADVQKIIDALPMAMIIENPETKEIYYANTAFYALMGYISVPETCNINETSLFNPEQFDECSAAELESGIIKLLEDEETAVIEFVYKSIRGKRIDTRVTASEIIYGGKKCVLKMIQDIGEEKLRTQLLENAADREREANRLKSTFLANMSHEIRTPMNAIIGFTQLALMREQEIKNVDTFKKINSSAKNLLTIINDILDFSKIEAQKLDLVESIFAVEDVIANAFMIASERIEEKKIEILLDMSPDLPLNLFGDKTRLWQILKNLLDNSAKYTEKGFIVLKVFPEEATDDKLPVTFEIQDTGIGMTQEQISMLFAPFSQFSDNYKYKTSGTGLGMSITKQLLDMMNGKIEVKSNYGVGTNITVTLPFKTEDGTATLSQLASKNMPGDFNVLIADDDPISCGIMQSLLETAGFYVICVLTGADAIKKVKEKEEKGEPFNVIILDYLLGEDNGIEVGRELLKYTSNSKLLMVSAYVKKIPGEEIRDLGFKDILQKPLIPSMFLKRLVDALGDYSIDLKVGYKKFRDVSILICEDNALNREIAVEMLNLLGIEPDVACDGYECLRKLEEKRYDLILMDILMPEMDGMEATRKIRGGNKPYKDTCILAMTANVMTEQVEDFMKTGMNGHIAKPVEFKTLHDSLAEFLPAEKQVESNEFNIDTINATFAINGVLVNEGLARFGGNEERYKSSLLRFANDKETYHSTEGKDFGQYIHTLKGVAGNLGISKLAELAKIVETEYRKGISYDESYKNLKQELKEVSTNIKAVAESKKVEKALESGSKDDYFSLLKSFKEALLSGNPAECEKMLNILNHTNWVGVDCPDFTQIEKAVDGYDFNKALELIEQI